MDQAKALILRKPVIILIISFLCLVITGVLKWWQHPNIIDILWFVLGGAIGVYLLDAAELFFNLTPSPFRSVVFAALFAAVGLFIMTSSASYIASGLVISVYLQLILWQIGEWHVTGNIQYWYRNVAIPVSPRVQQILLILFSAVFFLELYFFIH